MFFNSHLVQFPEPELTSVRANRLNRIILFNEPVNIYSVFLVFFLNEASGDLCSIASQAKQSACPPQKAEMISDRIYSNRKGMFYFYTIMLHRFPTKKGIQKKNYWIHSGHLCIAGSVWKKARVCQHPPARLPGLCSVAVA